jgi:hypothetical protein
LQHSQIDRLLSESFGLDFAGARPAAATQSATVGVLGSVDRQ